MYVNCGQISNQRAEYLISYIVDHIERIHYTWYYNSRRGTFTIYPRQIVTPGDYPPELFDKRVLAAHEVKRGY